MSTITVQIDALRSAAIAALKKKGAADDEAAIVVDDYIDADLRGRLSHGFAAFAVALGAFPKKGTYQVVADTGATVTIAGHGDTGHVVARRAIDLVEDRLETTGICGIAIRGVTRFNCPGPIARYAADKGFFAIVLEYGGQNFMTPPGGTRPALSTNPIGIAVPFAEPTFVVDIATSEKALGYVTLAKAAGATIPQTWGVDDQGRPTTDPNKVTGVSPFGGHNGFALSLAFELFSGALVGVPIGSKGSLSERGALILLLHPNAFGVEVEPLSAAVRTFLNEVQSCPTVPGDQPILYPGQGGEARRSTALAAGVIPVPTSVWNQITAADQQG